jgi:hypothetical protein
MRQALVFMASGRPLCDFPLHFHVNIPQGRDRSRLKVVSTVQRGHIAVRRNILEPIGLLTDLIYGKVLENYPRLRFVFAEYELSWVAPVHNENG